MSPDAKNYNNIDTSRYNPSTTRDNLGSIAGTTVDGLTNIITHDNSTIMPPQKSLMENSLATESVSFTIENL